MATFLLKTEPGEYSFDDLVADRHTTWTGISSAAALGHLRAVRKGDYALIYHTGNQKAIVGLAEFTSAAYADPASPSLNDRGEPKTPVADLKPLRAARHPVTLAQIKADKRFAEFAMVKQSRLSVMPVPPPLDKALRSLAGL